MKTSTCKKPNPIGIELDRLLLLTNKQRLIYIDFKTFELKGMLKFTKFYRVYKVNYFHFHFCSTSSMSRLYHI